MAGSAALIKQHPLRDGGSIAVAVSLGYLLVHIAAQGLEWAGLIVLGQLWTFNLMPVPLVVVALALRTSGVADLLPCERRGWRLVALGFAVYEAGMIAQLLREWGIGPAVLEPISAVGFILMYPLLVWGVFCLAPRADGVFERLKLWMDGITVVVGARIIVTNLFQASTAQEQELATGLSNLLYLGGDLLLLVGIIRASLRVFQEQLTRSAGCLILGMILFVSGDMGWGSLYLTGAYRAGSWPDTLWLAALVLLAAAPQLHWLVISGQIRPWRPGPAMRWYVQMLPYLSLLYAFSFVLVRGRLDLESRGFVWGALVATVAVIARQATVLRENSRLLATGAALTEELRRSESRFRSLVQHSSDVIAVVSADWRLQYASPAVEQLTGINPGKLVGQRLLDLVHPADAESIRRIAHGEATRFRVVGRLRNIDGTYRHVEAMINNLTHDPGVGGIVLNVRDVTDRQALEDQLAYQAYHDTLTGLGNRALFYDRLKAALASHQGDGRPLAVLFLDLDGFKTVNDSLGHQAGDQLLLKVASRLIRSAGLYGTVARLGGDEFAVLLEGCGIEAAAATAETLLRVLAEPVMVEGREVFVKASIGVAASQSGQESADDLLRNADVAMYAAKSQGKARTVLYHPEMHQRAVNRLELEADLRWAVEGNEFVVHYQPTVDLESGTIAGFEALVRWRHPRRGLIPPMEFIPLAEETGLIVPMGMMVLKEACRQAAIWKDACGGRPFRMAVNLSARQLVEPDVVPNVARVLAEYRLEPGSLVLEITESVLVEGSDAVVQTLGALKRLGVLIAIDDFGTGYSSLGYLRRFPADILKIDRTFVDQLGQNGKEAALVRAIADLSRTFGLLTVAEGVERDEQVAELRRLNCQLGQGYLFSRPVDAETAGRMLRALRIK